MGKLERFLKKPQRIIVYQDLNPIAMPFYQERAYQPYTEVPAPVFTITKVVGEKRKRVVTGSASDYVLEG